MSHLIIDNVIVSDEWVRIIPPIFGDEVVRKQAGKVVLFKLTGEDTFTQKQITGTEIPATGKMLIPLAIWLANKATLANRVKVGEIGVLLATHEPIESLADAFPDLNILPLIAVYVERFPDGRNFTLGNLLRTRYGYKNELRAVGDVLRDQLYFLKRSGFNSYEIRADRHAKDALNSLNDFSQPYQGAVDDALPIWRKVSRQ